MSISIAGLSAQKTLLLIALTVPPIACADPKPPPSPSQSPSQSPPVTYDVPQDTFPLPPGVSSNASQFRDQAAIRGKWGPTHTSPRAGICPSCTVDVEIGPLGDTRDVSTVPALSPAPLIGRAVAKILNRDSTRVEAMYRLKPSRQFEYYVWTDTVGSPSRARLTLLEVPAVGQPGYVRAVFQKNLQLCLHPPTPSHSDADFRWCEGVLLSMGVTVNHAGMLPIASLAALLVRANELVRGKPAVVEPPIWLRCHDGCCG
jgi:hypothetical protein